MIGACLAPVVLLTNLLATLLAFFAAVGLAAHALDELNGRPLRTAIPSPVLSAVAVSGLAVAIGLGAAGIDRVGWQLLPFLVVGPILVVAYNFELWGGIVHNDIGFGVAWGAFPVLTAYVAQTGTLAWAPVIAAVAAMTLSVAQRSLSTPARLVRRRTVGVEGQLRLIDGRVTSLDAAFAPRPARDGAAMDVRRGRPPRRRARGGPPRPGLSAHAVGECSVGR